MISIDSGSPEPHFGVILMVDDDADYRLIFAIAMRAAGLPEHCHLLEHGEEAVAYLSGSGIYADRQMYAFPHMLFLDINMPRMGGFAVLTWMRNNPQSRVTPTIVLSSSEASDDIHRAYLLGAQCFLTKPMGYGQLCATLRSALRFWAHPQTLPQPGEQENHDIQSH